jgi:hypothetical protein
MPDTLEATYAIKTYAAVTVAESKPNQRSLPLPKQIEMAAAGTSARADISQKLNA